MVTGVKIRVIGSKKGSILGFSAEIPTLSNLFEALVNARKKERIRIREKREVAIRV